MNEFKKKYEKFIQHREEEFPYHEIAIVHNEARANILALNKHIMKNASSDGIRDEKDSFIYEALISVFDLICAESMSIGSLGQMLRQPIGKYRIEYQNFCKEFLNDIQDDVFYDVSTPDAEIYAALEIIRKKVECS